MARTRLLAPLLTAAAVAVAASGSGGGAAPVAATTTDPEAGPPTELQLLPPDPTRQERRGARVVAQSGCEACHRLGANGNDGPGPRLTHIGRRLTSRQLTRVLVKPVAPMPSFRSLQRKQPADFRAMVAYLRALKQPSVLVEPAAALAAEVA